MSQGFFVEAELLPRLVADDVLVLFVVAVLVLAAFFAVVPVLLVLLLVVFPEADLAAVERELAAFGLLAGFAAVERLERDFVAVAGFLAFVPSVFSSDVGLSCAAAPFTPVAPFLPSFLANSPSLTIAGGAAPSSA